MSEHDILSDRVDALERILVHLVREIRTSGAIPDSVIRNALESAYNTDEEDLSDEVLHLWSEMSLPGETTQEGLKFEKLQPLWLLENRMRRKRKREQYALDDARDKPFAKRA